MFIGAAGLVFYWYWLGIVGLIGIFACMIYRSFTSDDGYYVSVEEIAAIENKIKADQAADKGVKHNVSTSN